VAHFLTVINTGATIYTAVNLGLYATNNPDGFLGGDWSPGQTLSQLGVQIVNGQIPGVEGIYWATTPFVFNSDPNTPGFTPEGGDSNLLNSASYGDDIVILQQHLTPVPVPSSLVLIASSIVPLFAIGSSRLVKGRIKPDLSRNN
jgi:hypothetical protein